MWKTSRYRGALIVLYGTLAFVSVACSSEDTATPPAEPSKPIVSASPAAPLAPKQLAKPKRADTPLAQPSPVIANAYERALDAAQSASSISQSAQSIDDWNLVINRWGEAIALLKAVPSSNPNSGAAKTKLSEYQRQLNYAQAQLTRPKPSPKPARIIAIAPPKIPNSATNPAPRLQDAINRRLSPAPVPPASSTATGRPQVPASSIANQPTPVVLSPRTNLLPPLSPSPTASPSASPSSTPNSSASPSPTANQAVFRAPIKRRAGLTPVIDVTFNGTSTFEMIVDTGASGTFITQAMAEKLSVVADSEVTADTASAKGVKFRVGKIKSIAVAGVVAKDVSVAIAGPDLDTGLLGHDFFGNYDITIKRDVIEFQARS